MSPSTTLNGSAFRQRRGRSFFGLAAGRGKTHTVLVRIAFLLVAAGLDGATVLLTASLMGCIFGHGFGAANDLVFGLMAATLFIVPGVVRHDYAITRYLSQKGHAKRSLGLWSIAVLGALVLAFLTKTTDVFSREASVGIFVVGYLGLLGARAALVQVMSGRAAAGRVASRHIFLCGDEDMIRGFTARHVPHEKGLRIVGAAVLRPEPESRGDDLALAAASARVLRPDDIYILVPWAEHDKLEACIDTFMGLPATIQLAPERFFDQFDDFHVVRNGTIASIHLIQRPLTTVEVLAKRMVDIALSAAALGLLAPVFLAVAIAIKLDSKGPVFFVQRRYGFNQEPFRILKFRSMTTMEDDRKLQQVKAGDRRITKLGRFLRRSNIDELPQLMNVLRGDMSLVGPRPHALAHDQAFEREVALYARRHNVRPGITGWAQVQGRVGIPWEERAELDAWYADNWSLLLDLSIMVRTVFSKKAYRNAR